MSKKEWDEIRVVGDVRSAMNAMEELLGEAPVVNLSVEALEKWDKLQEQYDAFYELDIQERLYFSGMATRPAQSHYK